MSMRWPRKSVLVGMHHQIGPVFLEDVLRKFIRIMNRETAFMRWYLREVRISVCRVIRIVLWQSTFGNELTRIVGDTKALVSEPMSRVVML